MKQQLQFGIQQLLDSPTLWKHRKLALVTNDAAFTNDGVSSRVALLKNGYNIVKLFSPEHGISARGEDGALQQHGIDALTGLPVISLYGEKLAPTAADLQDVDILLFDIPDIGCRFYTYLWTMTKVMEACAVHQKAMIILDRPNPIGGLLSKAEGPMLDPSCASFIGRWNIPLKHACTLGELARYFNDIKSLSLNLSVLPVQHYQRSFNALHNFSFVATSPAITSIGSAFFYPGTGLLEGVNINEGRGTDTPFTLFGAPWLAAEDLLSMLMPGANGFTASVIKYIPENGAFAGETCNGLSLQLTDSAAFSAVETGLSILHCVSKLQPQQLQERLYPTVANPAGTGHLNKLLGIPAAFQHLKDGSKIDANLNSDWQQTMANYLLY